MALPHEPVTSDPWQARVSVAKRVYAVYTGRDEADIDWDGMDTAMQEALALDTGSEATVPTPVNADMSAADYATLRELPRDVVVGMLLAYRDEARRLTGSQAIPAPPVKPLTTGPTTSVVVPHPGHEAAGLDPGDAQVTPEQALRALEASEATRAAPAPPAPSDTDQALAAFERNQAAPPPDHAPGNPDPSVSKRSM